eukprot:Hpha_TRINITY_DN16473_c1_g2::TRINITY_DN16473_c1_g2_i6::g.163537::m.163537
MLRGVVVWMMVVTVTGNCSVKGTLYEKCFGTGQGSWQYWGGDVTVDVPGNAGHQWKGQTPQGELHLLQKNGIGYNIAERGAYKEVTGIAKTPATENTDTVSTWFYSDYFNVDGGSGMNPVADWGVGLVQVRPQTALDFPFFHSIFVEKHNLVLRYSDVLGDRETLCSACVPNGRWNHLEIILMHTASQYKICLNGVIVTQSTFSYKGTPGALEVGVVTLGNSRADSSVYYYGLSITKRDDGMCTQCTTTPADPCPGLPSASPVTSLPTSSPTTSPSVPPTFAPTVSPLPPTSSPTSGPSAPPTISPTAPPIVAPSQPPVQPSLSPTSDPSRAPSQSPKPAPTTPPTFHPSLAPSQSPRPNPTVSPSLGPSQSPKPAPTTPPTTTPSEAPSKSPIPLVTPTTSPRPAPTTPPMAPSLSPRPPPTISPSVGPSQSPSLVPSQSPRQNPTVSPILGPSQSPKPAPTTPPTSTPSEAPSKSPIPLGAPSQSPRPAPTTAPTSHPSLAPSQSPRPPPTASPFVGPSQSPKPAPTTPPTSHPLAPSQSP